MMVRILGFSCVLFAALPASALEVLGPGQDAGALELKQRIQTALADTASVESVQIDKQALKLGVRAGEKRWEISLHSPNGDCSPAECITTSQGRLFGIQSLPQKLRGPVVESLKQGPPLLTWHEVVSKRPKTRALPQATLPVLRLDEALETYRAGRIEDAVALTTRLIQDPTRAPPGALSLHLALGGRAPASLDFMLEQFPLESRLHARIAQKAQHDGDTTRAARHLARALTLTPLDGLATALAKRQGWSSDGVSLGPEPELPEEAPAWPWILAYCILALLAWECSRRKSSLTLVVLVAGVVGSLLLPIGGSTLVKPELVRFQVAAEDASTCSYDTAGWIHGEFTLLARCSGQNDVLHLRAKSDSDRALAQTEHHELTLRGKGSAMLRQDVARLAATIQEHEGNGFRLETPRPVERSRLQAPSKGEDWQLRATFAWVLVAVLALFAAFVTALRELGQAFVRLERESRRVFLGSLVLLVAIQLIVGGRPIMVFEGYALTEGLAAGEIPRYGAGGLFFYGWTQWLGGTDHVSLMNLNIALGMMCIVLLLGWVHRLFGDEPRRLVWTAVLVVCLPVIVRTHGSESILIAPTAVILGALFFLAGTSPGRYVLAATLLGSAALSRPEMAVVACLIPLFAHVIHGESGRPKVGLAWSCLLVLAGIAIWSAFMSASNMSARDALPATDRGVGPIIAAMTIEGILADVRCFPVALSLLGLWAFTQPSLRRLAFASWALALLWMRLTGVDHTSASTPRTHLPVVFMMVPLVVASWTTFIGEKLALRSAVLGVLILAGTVVSAWYLHSPNNDDAEEALWQALVMDIQDEKACVVAVGDNDPPDRGRTSRHNPEYWVANAHPDWKVSPLSDLGKVRRTCSGKVYALLGVRCYTQIREPGESVPEGSSMHPICADVLKEKPARKVIEWDIENRSHMSHPMYPAGSPLRIGVYELAK